MNKTLKNCDGFVYVSYKGKKKRHLKPSEDTYFTKNTNAVRVIRNFNVIIKDIENELNESEFIRNFQEVFLNVLDLWGVTEITIEPESDYDLNPEKVIPKSEIDIVCYGLGQFSSCQIARYQLGFLLILKQILHADNVFVYDPQFSPEEINCLKELDLNVLNINEEGKRSFKQKSVCFLPHCDLPLYNNLLYANWSVKQLSELIIIGNSFSSYKLNDMKGQLRDRAKYVYLAIDFMKEISIDNNFHFNDIFNDLSIHYFQQNSLSLVDSFVWTDLEVPLYGEGDEIIKCT